MSALSKRWSAIKSVLQRWQDSRKGSVLDLKCCAEQDLERMAKDLGNIICGTGHWRKVPMLARIIRDAPAILFLAAGTILVVGITYLF
jgi:hypothetical protein